jgi:hypothetical protein
MAFSLYAATVPSFQQILGAVAGLLDKAEIYCTENGIAPTEVHSLGAIEGVRNGVFSPDMSAPPETFAALKSRVADTLTSLAAIDSAEVEGFLGRDVRFAFGSNYRDYTAEGFLLSFSLPNFYFHAVTAYDILRWKGLPIGKRDFMGKTRTKK